MLGLAKLRSSFQKGSLKKADYIRKMHRLHLSLFEYADFIKHTDVAKLIVKPDEVEFVHNSGIRMVFSRDDYRSQPLEVLNFGSYENAALEHILHLLPKQAVIFDIGAHTGWYSLLLSRFLPKAEIYAFEPVPFNFEYLNKNINLNKAENITAYNIGFSEKSRHSVFFVNPHMLGNASTVNLSPSGKVQKTGAKLLQMDHFIEKHTVKKIDFMKCDVEGGELFVFKGAKGTLHKYKPIVYTEMLRKWSAKFGYHPNDIIAFFNSLEYSCFEIKNERRLKKIKFVSEKTKSTNFFFLPKTLSKQYE